MVDDDEVICIQYGRGFFVDLTVDGQEVGRELVGMCDAVVSLVVLGALRLHS